MTKWASWPKVVAHMHVLLDLFHKIYNVRGIIQIGGLAAMAAVVFAETGLLVGFFLPGDSLLVTAGVFCTSATAGEAPLLNIVTLNLAVMAAAIVGDTVGYWIGAKTGPKIFTREQSLLVLAQAPPAHQGVLRAPRRQDDHHRPLHALRPHLRPRRRRRRADELPPLSLPSTSSAASAGS